MSVRSQIDLAEAFDKAFEREDKDRVIAGLLRKVIEERERRRPTGLVERMWRIRESGREVTEEEIRRARPRMRRAAGHMALH